ncbi:MAG: NAD(P)/FAD-dependent oxidoreductase [Candidatus Levybacteria bacterium]|nr:NAD(P)/FAD-dependent oxidoreductase [Candidatus Levybacteria bacterium]
MQEQFRNKSPTHDVAIDVGVIGAGVIGLSVARALVGKNTEVVVFEAEQGIGRHTSSRNSEVIHSGIYYNEGSLKARLCVSGKQLLYQYCEQKGIKNKQLGKIIVASKDEDIPKLELLQAKGKANGVNDLVMLDSSQVKDLEPKVKCVKGLFSPSTGILDSHSLMSQLRYDARQGGATILTSSPVVEGKVRDSGIALVVRENNERLTTVLCKVVINSAGLFSQDVARKTNGLSKDTIPNSFLAKGHYFELRGRSPFSHLVYPVPVSGGLGIHATLDIEGRTRFGPDVSWVNSVDYSFEEDRIGDFYEAIRTYYPALQEGDLEPGYVGIRPRLGPSGSPEQDFVIQGPRDHGVPGLINLYGIESPGLTASLALAEYIIELLAS